MPATNGKVDSFSWQVYRLMFCHLICGVKVTITGNYARYNSIIVSNKKISLIFYYLICYIDFVTNQLLSELLCEYLERNQVSVPWTTVLSFLIFIHARGDVFQLASVIDNIILIKIIFSFRKAIIKILRFSLNISRYML